MSGRLSRLLQRGLPAATAAFCAVVAGVLLFPGYADAHGLIGRGDLPLPDWLLAWGATLLLVGSFAALVLLWQQPKLEADTWRPIAPRFGAVLLSAPVQVLLGVASVLLGVLVVYSGLAGTDAPDRNFSITFIFVTFWLGLVVVSVLFGNVFRSLSPWRAVGRGTSRLYELVAGRPYSAPLAYPQKLGRWPAVAGIFGFLWLELVWGASSFGASGVDPGDAALGVLVYSAITFVCMALFGAEEWSERGEAFSVYFGMFASLSAFEVREGRLGVRRVLSGTTRWAGPAGSLALVLLTIGGTTFDGAAEGATVKGWITSTFDAFNDLGLAPVEALRLTNTLFLVATLLLVSGIFWAGIEGMRIVSTRYSARELARAFAHAFIPIALAYLVAHYFSLVIYQEQAQFTFLLSDPLGDGSDIFGTASSAIDYGAISATTIQWVQFGAIVTGHALALAIGHDRALAKFGTSRDASWSQAWMLVVMLSFSLLGLYLLSQANA